MPDLKEKLVELIMKADELCKPDDCKGCVADGNCFTYRAADILIANGVTTQGWIPVSDRLPETIIDVLAFSENGDESKQFIAYYSNKKWWDSTSNIRIVSVTHWMPLPQTPMCKHALEV